MVVSHIYTQKNQSKKTNLLLSTASLYLYIVHTHLHAQNWRFSSRDLVEGLPVIWVLSYSTPVLPVIWIRWHCLHEIKGSRPCFPVPLLGREGTEHAVLLQLFLKKIHQLLVGAPIKSFNEENGHLPAASLLPGVWKWQQRNTLL